MRYYIKTVEHVFVEFKNDNNDVITRKIPTTTWHHALYITGTLADNLGIISMGMLLRYIVKNKITRTDAVSIIGAATEYHKNNH